MEIEFRAVRYGNNAAEVDAYVQVCVCVNGLERNFMIVRTCSLFRIGNFTSKPQLRINLLRIILLRIIF